MCLERNVGSQRMLVGAYERHLMTTCGVTAETGALFTWHVSKFLSARYGRRRPDLKALRPQDTVKYVMELSPRWMPNTRKSAVTALRSFLRWLQMNGICTPGLVDSVPTVSSMRSSGIPVHISAAQLAALLRSFDRGTPIGLRGYAATLCMARLGLRVGEVAQITLDDVNWQEGILRLPMPKGRRERILPLPREVGEALVDYLRKGRPLTSERHIFVSHRPQAGTSLGKSALRFNIRKAFELAGLDTPSKGTRVLRHTAATQLIRTGATLKEIADVLGHSSIDTTGIYAKVDVPTLREVATPWPKEATR